MTEGMVLRLVNEWFAPDCDAFGPSALALAGVFVKGVTDPLPVMLRESLVVMYTEQRHQFRPVDECISFFGGLDFVVSAPGPFRRMRHHAGVDHVQVNVDQAPDEVLVTLHRGCMGLVMERLGDYVPAFVVEEKKVHVV